ncbi:MAG: hypothetical protein WBG90_04905 [Saonia sp.]
MKFQKTALTLFALVSTLSLLGQNTLFEQGKCTILSEDNKPTAFLDTIFKGKASLKLDSKKQSIALANALNVKNFRVEMDIAGAVMSGLGFRVADEHNYQFIYFRPGFGGTQEAIQYIPIYNSALSWVFYNYPTYETTADIKSLEWFHAAIEVRGNNLKVFVNNSTTPQMDITLLDTATSGGNFLLRSMFGPSYFSNITYKALPNESPVDTKPRTTPFLRKWEISQQFPRVTTDDYFDELMDKANASKTWKKIDDPNDDYVNFSKYFEYPQGVVVAKRNLKLDTDSRRILHFDFVGKLRILLNGEEVFNYDKIRFERIFDGTFRINLDLKKGDNELLAISEGDASFFGEGFKTMGRLQHTNWGFIARLEN